ncbi:hypothetical protein JYU29_05200 [Tianweitania sp. BSSL-BM11]|uniref:DUF945 domain-containing protein n=1 Tax=Tianweitania aestuarii TaxID=2814886 RepID=A0ABS5RSQ0_9HYPH|nr:hypothetical protein [Tianweitania aestuarii]MBS9720083.1 hypothetical protein [Tianweitania aestuarii]
MTKRLPLASTLCFTALALVLPITGAQAFELEQFGTRLKALSAEQGTILEWNELTGDESQVVAKGVKGTVPGMTEPVQLGDVTFSDIAEESDHYRVGSITMSDYSIMQEGATIAAKGIEVTGAQLPFDAVASSGMTPYDSAKADTATVDLGGKRVLTIEDINSSAKETSTGSGSFDITVAANRFSSDLFQLATPDLKPMLSDLGYETVTGKIDMQASWNTKNGDLVIKKNDFVVDDAGTLSVTFDIDGYTPALIRTIRETTEKMAAAPEADQSAQGMAMLGLMQQVIFNQATIRFEDDSLTNKIIGIIAKNHKTTPEAMINQAKAIVPFGLAQLNMPDFAQSVSNAVNSFLDDPKSIQIMAKPAQPLPFAQLAATGMMARGPDAPKAIINQLGISVSAND